MRGVQRAIVVEGLNLERFVRMAGEHGIRLHRIRRPGGRRITARAAETDLPSLAQMAEECGWKLTTGRREGAGRLLEMLENRWLLAAASALTAVLLMMGSQLLWRIEITGAESYRADVQQALLDMGIRPLMWRAGVEPGKIRDALEWRYPQVAWFECGWRGTTLEVRAVEGILPAEAAEYGPCDVVAIRDGIVRSIITRAGTPVVSVGDVIREGQVLIRGEERTSEGVTRPVAARGSVYARVWDTAQVRMSCMEVQTNYTGREQLVWTVGSPWFDLWRVEESGFAQQDVSVREMPLGGIFLPLVLRTERRMEAEMARVPVEQARLEAEGSAAALQKLAEMTGGKDSLVDNWVNWSMIDDEILLFTATGERIVDVAQQERGSGMAATE